MPLNNALTVDQVAAHRFAGALCGFIDEACGE